MDQVTFPMSDESLAAAIKYAGDILYSSGHTTDRYRLICAHYKALLDAQAKRAAMVIAAAPKLAGEE